MISERNHCRRFLEQEPSVTVQLRSQPLSLSLVTVSVVRNTRHVIIHRPFVDANVS